MTAATTRPDTPPAAALDRLPPDLTLDERMRALKAAADQGLLAPSTHSTQPWVLVLHRDRMDFRADWSLQLRELDPQGRELIQSVGAALINVRVALAARGWATEVDRFPRDDAPDLLAVVRPLPGPPDQRLARLASAVDERRTDRRRFVPEPVAADLVRQLASLAAAEGVELVPVVTRALRRLVMRLTERAAAQLDGRPGPQADRRWEPRDAGSGDAVDQPFLLLVTRADDPLAWLRSGEALERVLLELTRLRWAAGPVCQPIEVPATRDDLRAALSPDRHPQVLIRFGHPESARDAAPLRGSAEVLERGGEPVDGPPSSGAGTTR